jgi:hypothetical protein
LARHDLMLQAFGKKGLTKNQEIISKEKVMNSRVVSVYLETFNVTKACFLNINLENTSEPMIKRKGERGSPCLIL